MEILAIVVIVFFAVISWIVGRKLLDRWDNELPGWKNITDIFLQFMTLFLGFCVILLCIVIMFFLFLICYAIYCGITTGHIC